MRNRYPSMMGFLAIICLFLLIFTVTAQENGSEEDDGIAIPPEDTTLDAPTEPEFIWNVAWSPDGSKIAVGISPVQCGLENNIYYVSIVDSGTVVESTRLDAHNTCPTIALDWSPDGSKVFSGSGYQGTVWEVSSRQLLGYINSPSILNPFLDHDWSPDGNYIASVSASDSNVHIWDPLTGSETNSFDAGYPTAVSWSPDSTKLALAGSNIEIWDIEGFRMPPVFSVAANKVSWSPDGTKIAAVDGHDQVIILDVATGELLATLKGHTDIVNQVAWNPAGTTVASASDDGTVRVWDVNTGNQVNIFTNPGPLYALDWSPDGTQLVYGGVDGQINIVLSLISSGVVLTVTVPPTEPAH